MVFIYFSPYECWDRCQQPLPALVKDKRLRKMNGWMDIVALPQCQWSLVQGCEVFVAAVWVIIPLLSMQTLLSLDTFKDVVFLPAMQTALISLSFHSQHLPLNHECVFWSKTKVNSPQIELLEMQAAILCNVKSASLVLCLDPLSWKPCTAVCY